MAEDERKTNVVSWSVGDHRYDIDLYDIDGLEWRELKRTTGMAQVEFLDTALRQQDFDAIAGLLWVWRRRDEPELAYEDVLRSVSYRSLRWEAPPGEEIEGEEASEEPTSPPD